MSVTAERSTLHRLVDLLPERDLDAATRMLHKLLPSIEDPLLRGFLDASEDNEDLSPEDLEALAAADADVAAGRVISDAELCRRVRL